MRIAVCVRVITWNLLASTRDNPAAGNGRMIWKLVFLMRVTPFIFMTHIRKTWVDVTGSNCNVRRCVHPFHLPSLSSKRQLVNSAVVRKAATPRILPTRQIRLPFVAPSNNASVRIRQTSPLGIYTEVSHYRDYRAKGT